MNNVYKVSKFTLNPFSRAMYFELSKLSEEYDGFNFWIAGSHSVSPFYSYETVIFGSNEKKCIDLLRSKGFDVTLQVKRPL